MYGGCEVPSAGLVASDEADEEDEEARRFAKVGCVPAAAAVRVPVSAAR